MIDKRYPRLSRLATVLLGLLLLTGAVRFAGQFFYLRQALPVIRLWPDPEAQRRALLAGLPYDVLRQVDSSLPSGAGVLLVTSGRDVRRLEYTLYHRALYYLAPRPVWWLAPAPPDGTWESRWWISAPADGESVLAVASEQGAEYVLTYDLPEPLAVGHTLAEWPAGALVQLTGTAPPIRDEPRPQGAGPLGPVQAALGLGALFAIGYTTFAFVRRLGYSARGVEAASLAWLLGAGLASVAMLWLNAAGLSLQLQVAAVTVLALAGLLWMAARRVAKSRDSQDLAREPLAPNVDTPRGVATARDRPQTKSQLRITFYVLCLTHYVLRLSPLLLLAQLLVVTLLSLGQPLNAWDSWVNWGVKARTIFIEGRLGPAVFADPAKAVTHPDYPLHVPLLQAWLYAWLGAPDDRFAGLVSLCSYLALGGLCYSAARRRGLGGMPALAAATAVLTMSHLALLAGFAFADVSLAALALAAALHLAGWLETGKVGGLALAALAAGMLPWVKREGWVLLGALCLSVLVVARGRGRGWSGVAAAAAAAAVLSGPWYVFAARRAVHAPDFLPIGIGPLVENLGRLPVIARLALANLAGPDWSFAWPLAALFGLGLVAQRARAAPGRPDLGMLPLTALIYLALMALAFVFSDYSPYQQHVLTSWHRLAAHVAALPVLWLLTVSDAPTPTRPAR